MGRRWNNQGDSSKPNGRWNQSESIEAGRNRSEKALDTFAEMMIEKIKSFDGNWKQPWFTENAITWPKNLDGRMYNGMNALMLMIHSEKQGYKIPVFMTHDRIFKLNRPKDNPKEPINDNKNEELPFVHVNKGEKSFPVFMMTFTVVNRENREKIPYDDYKKMSEEERSKYDVFPKTQVYNVFNIDQTNIKEARPELYNKLAEEHIPQRPEVVPGETYSFPAVDRIITNNEWICPIMPIYQNRAFYDNLKKEIVVPEKTQFKNGEAFYTTLFHEMAHSTGSADYLNRLKPSAFGSSDYGKEELVAELTAALTSQRYGIVKNLKEDSVAYLKGWIDNLKKDPSFIKTVLTDVKKAENFISSHIDAVQIKIDLGDESRIEIKPLNAEPKNVDDQQHQPIPEPEEESVSEVGEKKVGGIDMNSDGQIDVDECNEEKSELTRKSSRRGI